MTSPLEQVRNFISRRRNAYCKTFMPNDAQLAPYAEEVLVDLAKFCRAHESTFHADPRLHAVAEGRREVFLRIANQLHLTDKQLWALHALADKE